MQTYTDYQYDPLTQTTTTVYYDYFQYDTPTVPTETVRNTQKAPIFSIAGIRQLTSRASLFFDSMLAFGVSNFTSTNRTGGFEVIYDDDGNVTAVTSSPKVVSVTNRSPVALYLMPGMRFQKNENRAFQIAVAGVSVWDSGDNITFPLPILSWFFKF